MQVMSHHWCTHKYKTNPSYGYTIDVLISLKQMQVMSYHWCTHKYKTNASYECTIDVLISIKQMLVMGAPLTYS